MGAAPSLRPHQCRGLAGRTLTVGNNGFYRHFGSKQVCGRGYARGAGRARLAPGGSEPRDRCVLADPHPASQTLPRRTVLFGLIPRLCVSLLQESDRAMSPGVLSWWPRFNTPPAYEPGSGGQSKTTPAGSRRSGRAPGGPSRTGSSSSGGRKGRLPGLLAPDVGQLWSGNCGLSLLPRSLPKHAPRRLWQETAGVPPGNRSRGSMRVGPQR